MLDSSDTLTSDQGLGSKTVICLQSGHPKVMDYQETNYLEKEVIWKTDKGRSYMVREKRSERNRHNSVSQPATQKSSLLSEGGSRSRSGLHLGSRERKQLEAKVKIIIINVLKTFTADQ